MKNLFLLVVLTLGMSAHAQTLNSFENGKVADADQINENFKLLEEQLAGKANIPSFQNNIWASTGWEAIYVDCDANSAALEESKAAIERGRNRIHVIIKGACILKENLFYITSQHVFLDGSDNGGSTSADGCASSATIRAVDPIRPLNISVTNGGTLLMACLTLDHESDVLLTAYTRSAIRTDAGVNAANQNLVVSMRNSLFRTFFNRHYKAITLDSGSYAEITTLSGGDLSNPFNFGDVTLRARSSLNCRICGSQPPNGDYSSNAPWLGGTINNLSLETASSLIFGLYIEGDVNIGSVTAKLGSSLLLDASRSQWCSDLFIDQSTISSGSVIEKELGNQINCDR